MTRGVATAEPIAIPGPAGPLEALAEAPAHPPDAVAVVCHPHPLHGGAMTNKVAHTLTRTFRRAGAAAVRFNFRGVGASAGAYADGVGEQEDAAAVVKWALHAYPGAKLYLAGFSFGAAVSATLAPRLDIAALVSVALPVARLPADFEPTRRPWLIVHGADDELVALDDVEDWRRHNAPDARLVVLGGATHFFHGRLTELAKRVNAFIAETRQSAARPTAAAVER